VLIGGGNFAQRVGIDQHGHCAHYPSAVDHPERYSAALGYGRRLRVCRPPRRDAAAGQTEERSGQPLTAPPVIPRTK